MSKVLLTGGNGFAATHILKCLLEHNYHVVTTVRSKEKGDQVLAAHKDISQERLSYVVVEDIAREGAFDNAVQSEPAFDFVIHTASPFPGVVKDPVKDVLDPAIRGTVGILSSIKAHAPKVKRVVITSSFAAIVNTTSPPKIYDESSWNPITWAEATSDPSNAYRGSKALAERAAWDFVQEQQPGFELVTVCPPLVYGPVAHHVASLDTLNTSNTRIRDFIQGKVAGPQLPPTGTFLFADVRDLAQAHVKALEAPDAAGKRFFITSGHCSNKAIVDAIGKAHPELEERLPREPIDDFPADVYGYDNSRAREILGINFRTLQECIGDTADSLLKLGA